MNTQVLAQILQNTLTPEQIQQLLEEITKAYQYGCCPLCECEDEPDASGGWREIHDERCLVTFLSKKEETERVEVKK